MPLELAPPVTPAKSPQGEADRRSAAVALLLRWAAEADALSDADAADNAAVLRTLDADRPSDRPLFHDLSGKPV